MIDWDLTDEELRKNVVTTLTGKFHEMTCQAERKERDAKNLDRSARDRRESEACARYSRRMAAHYQKAIVLLSAAPVPSTEGL